MLVSDLGTALNFRQNDNDPTYVIDQGPSGVRSHMGGIRKFLSYADPRNMTCENGMKIKPIKII